MTRAEFDALLHRQPTLAYEMVRVLSIRLRESDDAMIRDLQTKNQQLTRAYDELQTAQAQLIEKERLGTRAAGGALDPGEHPAARAAAAGRVRLRRADRASARRRRRLLRFLSRSAPIRWAS